MPLPQEEHPCRCIKAWTTYPIQDSSGDHSSSGPCGFTEVIMVPVFSFTFPSACYCFPLSFALIPKDTLQWRSCPKAFNPPSQRWVKCLAQSLTKCERPGLSDSKMVGVCVRGQHQSDCHMFTSMQMGQHYLLFCNSSQSCPSPGYQEAFSHGYRALHGWQACQGVTPHLIPRRCKQVSHRLPLFIVEGKFYIPNICLEGIRSSLLH